MKDNIGLKIVLCTIISVALTFIGFIGMFITAFTGGEKFYTPLVIVVTVAAIILTVLGMFKLVKSKVFKIITVSFLVICTFAVAGYEINKAYHKSFATVNDQGVDLNEYKPFMENTIAVRLEEASTLKMEDGLPRLDGATALYPLYSAFAQAVYPEKDYVIYNSEVMCNNTVVSYENLFKGEADIIFAARPSKKQMEDAKSMGVELKLTPIGREAFVLLDLVHQTIDDMLLVE